MKTITGELVEKLKKEWEEGKSDSYLKLCYNKVPGMRKSGLLYAHTQEEIKELAKCYYDPIYFFEKYIKVFSHVDGEYRNLVLRDYQKQLIKDYFEFRFNLVPSSRQMGKTSITAFLMLYEALFNIEHVCDSFSFKGANAVELMSIVQTMYLGLPFFMKPGVSNYNKQRLVFDNGSSIHANIATKHAGIGYTIHHLFIDEFAYIDSYVKERILNNLYPTISSISNGTIYISSGMNGYEKFYELCMNAERGLNNFKVTKLYWWQVEGRDDKWKESQIKMLGSKEKFMQEYELAFVAKKGEL